MDWVMKTMPLMALTGVITGTLCHNAERHSNELFVAAPSKPQIRADLLMMRRLRPGLYRPLARSKKNIQPSRINNVGALSSRDSNDSEIGNVGITTKAKAASDRMRPLTEELRR